MGQKNGQESAGASGNPIGCLGMLLLWTTVLGLGAWAFFGYAPRDAVRFGLGGALTATGLGCAGVLGLILLGIAAAVVGAAIKDRR